MSFFKEEAYVDFKSFTYKEQAIRVAEALVENQIEALIEEDSYNATFPFLNNGESYSRYVVKIHKDNIDKASQIFEHTPLTYNHSQSVAQDISPSENLKMIFRKLLSPLIIVAVWAIFGKNFKGIESHIIQVILFLCLIIIFLFKMTPKKGK